MAIHLKKKKKKVENLAFHHRLLHFGSEIDHKRRRKVKTEESEISIKSQCL